MASVKKINAKRVFILNPLPNIEGKKCEASNEESNKLKTVAYCRVSTGSEEQMTSYRAQIDYYKKYITNNQKYIFSGIYADEGISDTSLKKRDAFNRMIEDAKDRKLDMIITKSVSRFGRNTIDCLNSIRELKSHGVNVYFEKENIHTIKSEGEVLITLISAIAQSESEALSSNVKWGIRRRYEQGHVQSIQGSKFLGYRKDTNGNLVINESEADIVRRIYQESLDGFGYYQIAKRLTDDGIPTEQNHSTWNWSTLKKILTNEKYKGDTLCQKTYNSDPLTKHRIKNRGELPQYYYEDTHPAIIDKDTWKCVQLEFERQYRFAKEHKMNKFHQHSEEFPLSGKITCSHCSHTFVLREAKRIADYGYKYWICKSYLGGRPFLSVTMIAIMAFGLKQMYRKKHLLQHGIIYSVKKSAICLSSSRP